MDTIEEPLKLGFQRPVLGALVELAKEMPPRAQGGVSKVERGETEVLYASTPKGRKGVRGFGLLGE